MLRFRRERDFEFLSSVYDFPFSDFPSSGLIVSVSLSPHRVRASIMILEDNKPNISKPTNKSGNSGIQSNLHPRTIWEMRAIFAHEQFGKFEYPEGHPSVITHVSDRRNIQLLKNGIHPQGTPGWQLSLMSTGHRAPWTSNSGPRRTPCQPTHGHLGPPHQ